MKILFTIFDINNFGGITADLELKCKGLRELGHSVSLLMLKANNSALKTKKSRFETGPEGSYPSEFGKGIIANTDFGWYNIRTLGYACKEGIETWRKLSSKFDAIFHEIPNPPYKLENGELDVNQWWRKIYSIDTKQIIIAHDAHYRDMYPYIHHIAKDVQGITCTNHAGYVSLGWFPAPRAFVGAPHPILDWTVQPTWAERRKIAIAAHMWKAWKHQDKLVSAAPHLNSAKLFMAGDGIERRYITSETKCPKEFEGLWDAAVASKRFKYAGLITPDKLFKAYQSSRLMVDLSASEKFNSLGNHFNRSIIEGWNNGVIALCTDLNMRENNPPKVLFKKNVTHFEISHKAAPKEIAEAVDYCVNIPEKKYLEMLQVGRSILKKHFHYRECAKDFLKLLDEQPCGIYSRLETGKTNPGLLAASEALLSGKSQPTVKSMVNKFCKENPRLSGYFQHSKP